MHHIFRLLKTTGKYICHNSVPFHPYMAAVWARGLSQIWNTYWLSLSNVQICLLLCTPHMLQVLAQLTLNLSSPHLSGLLASLLSQDWKYIANMITNILFLLVKDYPKYILAAKWAAKHYSILVIAIIHIGFLKYIMHFLFLCHNI